MKIAIIGYSGSGKSTLARELGNIYGIRVLHLDSVHFLENWVEKDNDLEKAEVASFLDSNDEWIIDGNYSDLSYERRQQESDRLIILLFNRFSCLFRVIRRYRKYRNLTRPDMGPGCSEKLDWDFIKWVLFKGRNKQRRNSFKNIALKYSSKSVVIRNQKALDKYVEQCKKSTIEKA